MLAEDDRLSPYVPLWLLATGASMNVQYCTTAGFLSYIAKYVTKPEPHGVITDTAGLRQRGNNESAQMRFLNARIVGSPEAVFRLFGFYMKQGEAATHLCTKAPGTRRRAIARVMQNGDPNLAALRFFDGTMEQYARRPRRSRPAGQPQSRNVRTMPDFEQMLYRSFHENYEVMPIRSLTDVQRNGTAWWVCVPLPSEVGDAALMQYAAGRCVVPRAHPRITYYDWLLPSKHQEHYFYQRLLLQVTWRDATPEAFIKSYRLNPTGSLRRECELRTGLPVGDIALRAAVAEEAHARHFSPEAIERMQSAEIDADTMQRMVDAMTEHVIDGADDAVLPDAQDDDSTARLRDEIARARLAQQPVVAAPRIEEDASGACYPNTAQPVMLWYESGGEDPCRLTLGQFENYELLQNAGTKQITAFLSGEGGVGKSTLVRLLVQKWRSMGLNVIVMASSAKAARLIGGHTVHSACALDAYGRFEQSRIEGTQGEDRFVWLTKADIIVIDEISMLTTSALHGVNQCFNYVMVTGAGVVRRDMLFGLKSVIAVGDLFQLPSVEKGGREQQVYQSVLWPRFHFIELTKLVRADPEELAFRGLLTRVRTAWTGVMHDSTPHADFKDADETLLKSRVCSSHCDEATQEVFTDVQRLRPTGGTRNDEHDHTQQLCHCRVGSNATVLAARCKKVDELNAAHLRTEQATGTHAEYFISDAKDIWTANGRAVTCEAHRARADAQLSGHARRLQFRLGQRVIITTNRRTQHTDYANGTVCTIKEISRGRTGGLIVRVRPDEWSKADTQPSIAIYANATKCTIEGKELQRTQLALIPAHAMTVHRVQGMTLENDVHILLNSEFFADGQYAASAASNHLLLVKLH